MLFAKFKRESNNLLELKTMFGLAKLNAERSKIKVIKNHLLGGMMKGEQQEIKKAAATIGSHVKDSKTEEIRTALQRATRKGASPKEALGLTDAMVEGVYGQAYRLYNTGKYKEAAQIFRLLVMINSTESKYSMGLAASFHMMKDFQSAANTYSVVGILDPQNPIPYYHASDCYTQMGDPVSALVALEMAIKRAGDRPEFNTLKDRALLTAESLKKEIEKKKNNT
jgi:type III secretion system low calcium response chaperone LcrH/SycD